MRKLVKSAEPQNPSATENWQSEAFRSQILIDQEGKCAYCEFTRNGAARQLDHYRPKDNVKTARGSSNSIGRGYAGLRNEWRNLLYSCTQCNSSKGTLFPLEDEKQRNVDALCMDDVRAEKPLLLNPYEDEVGDYICFDEFRACPRTDEFGNPDQRGLLTIEVFHLNNDNSKRKDLVDAREIRWNEYVKLKNNIKTHHGLLASFRNTTQSEERDMWISTLEQKIRQEESDLAYFTNPSAPFAGMFINQAVR